MMQQLILGLFILVYLAWSVFTVIMAVRGKKTPDMPLLGKLIWYHGNVTCWIMVGTVACTLAIILSKLIVATLNLEVVIP